MEAQGRDGGDATSPLLVAEHRNLSVADGAGVVQASGDDSPATAFLVLSIAVAVCGSYTYGFAGGYSSPAESGIMADLNLTLAEYSVFGSIMTIGLLVGALFCGKVADLVGRRVAMGFADIFCIIGWLAMAFSDAAWLLDLGRLLLGFGICFFAYVVPVYIAEIAPKNFRGRFTAIFQIMMSIGVAATYLIGSIINWRTLALVGAIPCIVQFIGVFFIPESPRWLANTGREKEYEAALHRLRGGDAGISEEAADIKNYTETVQSSENSVLQLFQRKYAHPLIVATGLMVLQQFGGSTAIVSYASSIFELAGFSGTVGIIAMAIIQVPVTVLGALLLDKYGRRPLLLASAGGTCLGCFLVGLSFLLQDLSKWKAAAPVLVLVGILIYSVSYGLGIAGIPWIIMSEIFPIHMKGLAGSLVTLVNGVCSWIVSYSFNFLLEWNSSGTFFMFSVVCFLTIPFVAKLVPETKGRSLEEIQAAMTM